MTDDNVIVVEGLGRDFGPFTAVHSVDFTVRRREIFGFLGPNGAGKTTTINMLATLLKPTRGRAELAGHDVVKQPMQVRQSIGMVFQDPSLDDRLTADENLQFHAMIYNVPVAVRRERTDQVLGIVGLTDRRKSLVRHLLRRHETAAGDRPRTAASPNASCSSTSRRPASIRSRATPCGATSAGCATRSASPSS